MEKFGINELQRRCQQSLEDLLISGARALAGVPLMFQAEPRKSGIHIPRLIPWNALVKMAHFAFRLEWLFHHSCLHAGSS